MFSNRVLAAALMALTLAAYAACSVYKNVFSMKGSILLFAYPDSQLLTADGSRVNKIERPDSRGRFYPPALSADGTHVAWGIPFGNGGAEGQGRFALGISLAGREQWRLYGDFEQVGVAAFSPTGSKVAFVAQGPGLMILDVATGRIEAVEGRPKVPILQTSLGWSPDGRNLALEVYRGADTPAISVVNLRTGALKVIGEGHNPSWSPTGDWIAYFDSSWEKCILVHPDGTGSRMLLDIHGHFYSSYRQFAYGAVWSPNGKQVLLNEMKGEKGSIDVVLMDIESGKTTRKSKDGPVISGWAAGKP